MIFCLTNYKIFKRSVEKKCMIKLLSMIYNVNVLGFKQITYVVIYQI